MRLLPVITICFLLSLLFCCSPKEKKTTIGYIQITEDEVLNKAKKGLFDALSDSGFIDGQNIRIIDNNAQGDLSMIPTILQSFKSQGVD